jgi:hypothetical protein
MSTFTCPQCPDMAPTIGDVAEVQAHYDRHHRYGRVIDITELAGPGQDWHARAINAVKRYAATAAQFTFYDIALQAGEPDNPKARWGAFSHEIEHLGLARPVSYQRSERPESKGSAVCVWQGIPATARRSA